MSSPSFGVACEPPRVLAGHSGHRLGGRQVVHAAGDPVAVALAPFRA
ncbi:hypothetical protein [Kibdelosporangium philippinense]